MRINILKMNFVDKKFLHSDRELSEVCSSKRYHIIMAGSFLVPTTITYMTSRIRDKKLKHKHRPIPVKKGNKSYVKQLRRSL